MSYNFPRSFIDNIITSYSDEKTGAQNLLPMLSKLPVVVNELATNGLLEVDVFALGEVFKKARRLGNDKSSHFLTL